MKQGVLITGILLTVLSIVMSACGMTMSATPAATATSLPTPTPKPSPKLSNLKVLVPIGGGSELDPAFSPNVTEYALCINSDISDIGIVPSLPDQSSDKITIDGSTAESGAAAMVMPAVGTFEVKIVVNAEGGESTTYNIAVCREDIQPIVDKFLKLTYTDPATGIITMGYRLFVPEDYDPTQSYPLVMFLHGAGERGSNNEIQLTAQPAAEAYLPQPTAASQSASQPPEDCVVRCGKSCSYPGRCRRYTDANNNQRCDLGECLPV